MIPDTYKIAFAALDAIYERTKSDSLGILIGGMAINANDQISMDPAILQDWKRLQGRLPGANNFELILAFLDFDASLYTEVPDDLRQLIDALHKPDSAERNILDSVLNSWHDDPESWPLYSQLTLESDK